MSNRYLEKIAFNVGGPLVGAAKAIGRVALKGAKATTNQVYKATGGTFMDYAAKNGVKDVEKLTKFKTPASLNKIHRKANPLPPGASPEQIKARNQNFRDTVKKLKNDQTDARITVGAIGAGAAYAGSKVKEKLDEPKVNTYPY